MKKYILLTFLLFSVVVTYSQEESTLNVNLREGEIKTDGIVYNGEGVYTMTKKSRVYEGKKKFRDRTRKVISQFCNNQNADFKTLSEDMKGGENKKITITFEMRSKDGGYLMVSKKEAKREIMSLKEYLDLGIITKEEFAKKAESLKKILLRD